MKNEKKFLYGPILFKTLFISFITCFFLSPRGFAVNSEDFLASKSRAFLDEKEYEDFLLTASLSPVVFEGMSKEVTVMPMGMASLPVITFDKINFLKGENLKERTFPMRGKIQVDKLTPGRIWLAALQKIENSEQYELKAMIVSDPAKKKQLIDLLAGN